MTNKTNYAKNIAEAIDNIEFTQLSEESITLAEQAFVDTTSVIIAGANTHKGKNFCDVFSNNDGGFGILGQDSSTSKLDACLIHGYLAHILDFDDSECAITWTHPSASIIPSIVTLSDEYSITGEEAVSAYISGFEAQYQVGAPISPEHYRHGWHSTSTLGVFSAAISAASVMGLNKTEITNTLNICTSMSAGINENWGTDTKALHVGHAVRAGLTAAMLAEKGFDASSNAFFGSEGFFHLYTPNTKSPNTRDISSNQLAIEKDFIYFKKYPCCHGAHTSIKATLDLLNKYNIPSKKINKVIITVPERIREVMKFNYPRSPLEAKFSLPYIIACSIIDKNITIETFVEDSIEDKYKKAFFDKIGFKFESSCSYSSNKTRVEIDVVGGKSYSIESQHKPGAPEIGGFDRSQFQDKFQQCLEFSNCEVKNDYELFSKMYNLRGMEDISLALDDLKISAT